MYQPFQCFNNKILYKLLLQTSEALCIMTIVALYVIFV